MALIKRRERDSHWYHRNGDPCHTVMGKTTGLPRPTTVTDAKKMNLVPSVTNILGMKAKPALDVWKLDKAILAAIQLERMGGETDEMFASRIAEASEEETRKAAEWGTLLHEQIEHYNVNKVFSGTSEILQYVAGYEQWYRDNVIEVISAEQSCVSSKGYAGRLDIYAMINHEGRARRAIVDAKSQRLKGKRNGVFYLEWAMQLAAYAECITEPEEERPLLVSLLIPSDAPGPIQPKIWDNYEQALAAFMACFTLWKYDKGYWIESSP
jgi:hypothetical protein